MSTYLWFVPGFMGSNLRFQRTDVAPGPLTGFPVWGDLQSVLSVDRLQLLKIPLTSPAPAEIRVTGIVDLFGQGYGDFLRWLRREIPGEWQLAPFPFDWRLSVRTTGRYLANALETNHNNGHTNVVLAHSQGALVAWAAWANLVDDGQTAAMSRFVTFGGALYGTSSTPGIFEEEEDSLALLARAFRAGSARYALGVPIIGVAIVGATAIPGVSDSEIRALIEIARTWPGMYDLYPDASLLDDPGDTNRSLLWDNKAWGAALAPPDFDLLNTEITNVHKWLRVGKYIPPAAIAAHVVGYAQPTFWRVTPPFLRSPQDVIRSYGPAGLSTMRGRNALLPGWLPTRDGDGRCTFDQQRFPQTHYYQVANAAHATMQNSDVVRQLALAMLTMPAFPVAPTPDPAAHANPWAPPPATDQPQFLIDAPVVSVTPPAQTPRLPVRVGGDP